MTDLTPHVSLPAFLGRIRRDHVGVLTPADVAAV